ncbi:Rha family transcriptional regulator [Amaricoccus solimangrovi]|uniref:Rha family transcriptional regulator n=1 Tax=Amaricoccus solimangrovi TaxID=2589815 RepID=A0A501WH92_9RHOB|nr:Rha family transcriptional regulator [Amaricoccus solimangrovi]TPE48919.1 Rha family transcriptional regulator [Amaricoccus solimangrovi]
MTDQLVPTAASLIKAGAVFRHGAASFTTSLAIAKHFGKRHANVLRAIDDILETDPTLELNFELELTPVSIGNGGIRHVRTFRLNRRAVALLVFGFKGKKALAWKNTFLDAFDIMAENLNRVQWDEVSKFKATPANEMTPWQRKLAKEKAAQAKTRRLVQQSHRPN